MQFYFYWVEVFKSFQRKHFFFKSTNSSQTHLQNILTLRQVENKSESRLEPTVVMSKRNLWVLS